MSVDLVGTGLELVAQPESKPFRKEGLGYLYEPANGGVRLAVDFINRHRDELTGEILIECLLPGVAKHVHQARFNLSSTTSRSSLAKHLDSKVRDIKWDSILEAFCAAVLRAERRANEIVRVGRLDYGPEPPDAIEKLLPSGMATQLFAPGKTGKGWIAWGMAIAVETGTSFAGFRAQKGHPLYLDWEDNPKIANQRVQMIARGMGLVDVPEMDVMSMHTPLRLSVNELARVIDSEGYTMLIIDSAQKAIGAGGEYQSYESGAGQMFEAMRMLGDHLTVLLIDHVNKTDATKTAGQSLAYGSVMKGNWVRNIWEVRKDQEEGSKLSHLGLYHGDTNHTEKYKPIGLLLDFQTPGEVHITQDNIADSPTLSTRMSIADRCAHALRNGPLSAKEIATEIDATQESVRVILWRDRLRFRQCADKTWEMATQLTIVTADDGSDLFKTDEDLPF